MGMKERLAETKKQQEIAKKVFSNSVLKDKDGNAVSSIELGGKYLLYSKDSDKKIGWIKLAEPGKASVGWVNLPDYMKMEEPADMPEEFKGEAWDAVDLSEYDIEDIAEPEMPDRTDDVLHYVQRMGAAYHDNIYFRISDRDFSRLQDLYESQCNYENLDDAMEILDTCAMYDQVQYRQSKGVINNSPKSFDTLSEQLGDSIRTMKAKFEESYPDLNFNKLLSAVLIAKYPSRAMEAGVISTDDMSVDDAAGIERYSYMADYSGLQGDYQRSKRSDAYHDGMTAAQWKDNRMKMHEQYVTCDFMERDYKAMYDRNIYEDAKSMEIAKGPARSIAELDQQLDTAYSGGKSGRSTESGIEF